MGNTNSTEENNLVSSYQQRRRSRSNSSASIHKPTASTSTSSSTIIKKQPFQLTVTEPITETEPIPVKSNSTTSTPPWSPTEPAIQEDTATIETKEIPINNKMKEDNEETPAKAVPVSTGKSGWVSSTGAASPWYGSLSSSTSSSHHRPSISGPYYRTRGMSVTRDSENDEDLTSIISNANATPPINTSTTTTNTTIAKTVPLLSTNQGEFILV